MVAGGGYHTICLSQEGSVYTWGRGIFGQLGIGESKNIHTPKLVMVRTAHREGMVVVVLVTGHSRLLKQNAPSNAPSRTETGPRARLQERTGPGRGGQRGAQRRDIRHQSLGCGCGHAPLPLHLRWRHPLLLGAQQCRAAGPMRRRGGSPSWHSAPPRLLPPRSSSTRFRVLPSPSCPLRRYRWQTRRQM